MDLLVSIAREEGTTVVLVTHDARVAAYADREAIVRDGKVTASLDPVDPAGRHAGAEVVG
jgi:putative ABC transport system ATP-binding protein